MFNNILNGLELKLNAAQTSATVSWTYYSSPTLELAEGSLQWLDPAGETFLCRVANSLVLSLTPVGTPLVWFNGGDIFSNWTHSGTVPPSLVLPEVFKDLTSRSELGPKTLFVPINAGDLAEGFHFEGQNYPGPGIASGLSVGSWVRYQNDYPGWAVSTALDPQAVKIKAENTEALSHAQISQALTSRFAEDLNSLELKILAYWQENLGLDSGNTDLWGLQREPWKTIIDLAPELVGQFIARSVPQETLLTRPCVRVWVHDNFLSIGDFSSWKFKPNTPITIPGNYGLRVFNYRSEEIAPPLLTGGAFGDSGTLGPISWTRNTETYTPTVDTRDFDTFGLGDFKPGYKYIVYDTDPLPFGFINLGLGPAPNTTLGILLQTTTPATYLADFYHRKLNVSAFNWACDLAKLTFGLSYDTTANIITSTGLDLTQPLRLWRLEPTVVGPDFFADCILGYDTNQVCVRLPLHYKRDGKEWKLAHAIAKAFLPAGTYTIGYHEFVADYSVADEPVFRIDEIAPPAFIEVFLTLSIASLGYQSYVYTRLLTDVLSKSDFLIPAYLRLYPDVIELQPVVLNN